MNTLVNRGEFFFLTIDTTDIDMSVTAFQNVDIDTVQCSVLLFISVSMSKLRNSSH